MHAPETAAVGYRLRGATSSAVPLRSLAPLVLALVTWRVWPAGSVLPSLGLDPSWKIGLHLAATHGLVFGRDVAFTYGPLGFLAQPLTVTELTGALSIGFALAVWLALAVAVLAAARRTFPPVVAFALAYLVLCLPIQIPDALALLAFLATICVLELDQPPPSLLLVPAAGLFAAVALLVKLNDGAVVLALFALAAWRLRPRRLVAEAVLGGSFVLSTVALWLLSGNPLGALPHWLGVSSEVIRGYSQTMALEAAGARSQYVWAGALLVAAAALLWRHLRRRVALWAATALFAVAFLKEGFVRHDGHVVIFFSAFAVALLAFGWQGRRLRALAAFLVVAAASAVVATPELGLGDVLRPASSASAALSDARLVVDPARMRDAIDGSRAAVRAQAGVDPALVRLVRGHTTAVVPEEISVAWAYGLRWRPEPTLQDYAAYDVALDEANARAIERDGAERVLQTVRWPGVDGTQPLLEAPATTFARLCRYRALRTAGSWTVLERTANRCGTAVALGSRTARAGERIAVPAPPRADEAVVAHVELRTPLATRLAQTVFKPVHLPKIVLGSTTYRFVAANAEGPLLLRLPAGSGLPPFLGGSVDYGQLTLLDVPSPFTIRFSAVPLAGAGRAAVAPQVRPVGRLESGAVVVGGRRLPVGAGTAAPGQVDTAFDWGRTGGVICSAPAGQVAVFVGDALVAIRRVPHASSDVRLTFHLVRGASVRVFALSPGRATELAYPAGYAWR